MWMVAGGRERLRLGLEPGIHGIVMIRIARSGRDVCRLVTQQMMYSSLCKSWLGLLEVHMPGLGIGGRLRRGLPRISVSARVKGLRNESRNLGRERRDDEFMALDDCIVTRLYYSLRNLEFRDFHLIHDLAGIQLNDLAI